MSAVDHLSVLTVLVLVVVSQTRSCLRNYGASSIVFCRGGCRECTVGLKCTKQVYRASGEWRGVDSAGV